MRKILVISLLLPISFKAQDKLLTIQDAVLKGRTSLAPAKLQNLQFVPGSANFFYVDNNKALRGDNASGKTSEWFKLTDLNAALKTAKRDTLKGFPPMQFKDAITFWFNQGKDIVHYNTKTKTISTYSINPALKEEDADESSISKNVAYTKNYNLYVNVQGEERQISIDGSFDLVYGKSAHQNEFGIQKGTFWSPKGDLLAFYRMDQTDVFTYPIVDWSPYPAKNVNIKYPMAGSKSHYVTVGIYNVSSQTVVYLKTKEPKEHYLTNIAFSPDQTKIYLAELNREQNFMQLNEYDIATGNFIRTLFEEKDEKYVEPLTPMQFVPKNPKQFVWRSRRDGWNHLYLYDISGKLVRQLTSGQWEVKATYGFDAKGERLFFYGNSQGAITQDLYSVSVKTGEVKMITKEKGTHGCMVDESGTYVIDSYSSVYTPRIYNMINTAKQKAVSFFTAEDPIKDYKLGKWSLFTIKNSEGTDLYCRMFKPVDFDSTKKYPVLVYLYNGPHSQYITNSWMAGGELWYQYMAQKGFIVFGIEGRGTSYRGKTFEQAIHRQLGKVEMEDQLKGVDYLKSLPYVDANRLGIHGWSYGGFMTTSMMTRNPGVFKVGVAGGPVIDWSYYEIMYGERYMDMPQENKEGYDKNNLLNYVDKLKGKLMIIHGAQDGVVVWQHSMMYVKKCVDKGVQIDYFVYPGHEHNVLGKDRAHLMEKICNYFIDNL